MAGSVKLLTPSGGSVTINAVDTASALSVTLPATSDTITTNSSTQTLTNKTLTNPVINGFTGDTSVVNIGSGQIYKDTSGNVGIGTSSPGYKLDITGTGTITSRIGTTSAGPSGAGLIFQGSATSYKNWVIGSSYAVTSGGLEFIPSTTNGGNTFTTPAMVIDPSSNVGIGTNSPSRRIHAYGVAAAGVIGIKSENNDSTGATLFEPVVGGISGAFGLNGTGITGAVGGAGNIYIANYYASGGICFLSGGNTERVRIDSSGNVSIGSTTSSGYKFLVQGTNADCARFVALSGRADLTLTSSGVISYDVGTNTDSSFSVRQNGTYDFLRLYNNGNIGVGYAAATSITTGTGNVIIGRGAGSFVTTSNNNVVLGDSVSGAGYNYISTISSSKQTIIGDSISEIVYPTWTSFNGTYTMYDFALNQDTGGIYEVAVMVNTNGGGSSYYRAFEKRWIGCNVNWGGAAYNINVSSTSLYTYNGTPVSAVVIYNSNNSTEYTPTYYNASSHTTWTTSGFYLRVKVTGFNTNPIYIGAQKVILRKIISG